MKTLRPDEYTSEARRAGRQWALLIGGWLAFVVAVNFYVARIAEHNRPNLVVHDYYERSLNYDRVVADGERVHRLGLTLEVTSSGQVRLDRDGAAVALTGGTLSYYRPSNSAADFAVDAVPEPDGRLEPRTPPHLAGHWIVTLRTDYAGTPVVLSTPWYSP